MSVVSIFYNGAVANSILTGAVLLHKYPNATVYNTGGNSDAEINAYAAVPGAVSQDYTFVATEVGVNGARTGLMLAAQVTTLDAATVGLAATEIWNLSGTDYSCKTAWELVYPNDPLPKIITDMGTYTSAVATAGGQSTLSDTAAFTIDAEIGKYIYIISGQGKGQARLITDNTATIITVSQPWDVVPTTTSYYKIVSTLQEAYLQATYAASIEFYLSNIEGSIKVFKALFDKYVGAIAPKDRETAYDEQQVLEMLNGTYGRDLLFPTWTS